MGATVRANTDAVADARNAVAAIDDLTLTVEDRPAALAKLQRAAEIFIEAGDNVEAARALSRAGRLQLQLNDPHAAVATHRAALNLLSKTADVRAEVDNLNGLAAALLQVQSNDEAERLLKQAASLSEATNYTAGHAQALQTLSDLQNQSDHEVALKTAKLSLSLWQSTGDKRGVATTLAQLGQICTAFNSLFEATDYYHQALRVWRELDNKSGQAGALIALGFIEYRKGSWQEAITYHTQAQQLVDEKHEPRRMGQIAVGIAEALNESGLPEIGLDHFLRGLEYYRQTQDPAFVAYGLYGVGLSYYLLGKYQTAVGYFNQSLAAVPANSIQAAQCHEYLGRIYIAEHQYQLAKQHLLLALATYQRTKNRKEGGQAEALLGEIAQELGQTAVARRHYERALQIFVTITDRLNEAATQYAVGRLELEQSNLELAERHLRKSIELTENIRRVSTSSDLIAAFSATVHDRYQAYIDCLMRMHQRDPGKGLDVTAFETSDLARGRALAELLNAIQTSVVPGLDPQIASREKSLRQALRVKEDYKVRLLGGAYTTEQLSTLDEELTRLGNEYQQVVETIRQRHLPYGEISQPTKWHLKQIQDEIVADDETVLLEYSLGPSRSYVWAVTKNGIATHELPAQAEITTVTQELYSLLKSQPDKTKETSVNESIKKLTALVLKPVGAVVNKKRIIVVADGALNYIPFQILLGQEGDGPLVSAVEVINAPSASVLGQLGRETSNRTPSTNVLAAFGDPTLPANSAKPSEDLAVSRSGNDDAWHRAARDIDPESEEFNPSKMKPLIFSKFELANLRDVAGSKSMIATGAEASCQNFERLDLSQYSILHISTHGILDSKRPENSGLLFSMVDSRGQPQDGFLRLGQIYQLRAPVDLVVLSACQTGLGKDVRGEGLIGLTRGFIYAGASSVVASLWKVDDEATAELMKRFYTNMLRKGMPPAAALRAAQNSIRQEPQWSSPYYWAAFTFQGDFRQTIPPVEQGKSHSTLLVLAVLAALVAASSMLYLIRSRRGRKSSSSR